MNSPPLPQPAGQTCPRCGTGWDTGSPYCPNCGQFVGGNANTFWSSTLGLVTKIVALCVIGLFSLILGGFGACLVIITIFDSPSISSIGPLLGGLASVGGAGLLIWGAMKLGNLK